jgi:ABC-type antimicrobial peptide transport system permease subunit
MGTDNAGRDVFTRAIYGGRISLRIGAYVAAVQMTLGVILGLFSGYYAATWVDDIINAIIMTLGSIPLLFLLIILAGTFSIFRTPEGLAFMLGIFGWMGLSRLLRGQIFSVRAGGAGIYAGHLWLDGIIAIAAWPDLLGSRAGIHSRQPGSGCLHLACLVQAHYAQCLLDYYRDCRL